MKSNTLIIIPAYNEEKNILTVINDIKNTAPDVDILIINDGSTDNTEDLIKKKNIPILSLPFNFGYGNALQLGFKYAVENNYEYIVQFDGDGQHLADDIIPIIKKLETDKYDIVIGSRFIESSNFHISFSKKIAINFLRFLIHIFSGYKICDPTSGLQGLSKRTFKYYSKPWHFPDDYPDADILIKMLKLGYTAIEIPSHMKERKNGKSMHSGIKPILYMIKISLSIFVVVLNYHIKRRKKY